MKKVQDCSTCKFVRVDVKEYPCNCCSLQTSGYVTSMWKPK